MANLPILLMRWRVETPPVLQFPSPSVLRWTEKRVPGTVAVPSVCSIGAVADHETALRSTSVPVRPVSPQFIGAVAVRLYNHSLCARCCSGREGKQLSERSAAPAGRRAPFFHML